MTAQEYFDQGVAAYETQDLEQAIVCFTKAIELGFEPLSLAYLARGGIYAEQKKYEDSIQDYTRAIRLEPTFTIAYNYRGFAYNQKSRYDLAVQDFSKAIELEPDSSYYNSRGIAHYSQGNYKEAIYDYTQSIQLDPYISSIVVWSRNIRV